MDLGLNGKVALVAGASRGLGFAVARELAREGARVSIASRDESAIRSAAERIGGEVLPTTLDVRSAEGIQEWVAATERKFGGIDLLFTNSGGPPAGASPQTGRLLLRALGRFHDCSQQVPATDAPAALLTPRHMLRIPLWIAGPVGIGIRLPNRELSARSAHWRSFAWSRPRSLAKHGLGQVWGA